MLGQTPNLLRNFKLYNEKMGMYLVADAQGVAQLQSEDPLISSGGVFYYYPDWKHLALLAHVDGATGQPMFIRPADAAYVPEVTMPIPDVSEPQKVLLMFNNQLLSQDASRARPTEYSSYPSSPYTLKWASTIFYLTNGKMSVAQDSKIPGRFFMTDDISVAQQFEFLNDNIILHNSYKASMSVPWKDWTVDRLVVSGTTASVQTVAVSKLTSAVNSARYEGNVTQLCVGRQCFTLTVPNAGKLQLINSQGNEDINLRVNTFFPDMNRRHTIVAVQYPRDVRQAKSLQLDASSQIVPIVFAVLAAVIVIAWVLVGYIRSNIEVSLFQGHMGPTEKSVLVNLLWYPGQK